MDQDDRLPYVIFEVANTHCGKENILRKLIEEYRKFDYPKKGIKFQPFKPNLIALPDYQWYEVYKELYFEPAIWKDAIASVVDDGDVWLDLFDLYGVEIFKKNKEFISGVKLQASVLDNQEVFTALSNIRMEKTRLIINISGYGIRDIEYYLEQFENIQSQEMVLQIGYQSYPTSIPDTGLHKIDVLKAAFTNLNICFADHSPAEQQVALDIPVWAVINGCSFIEKHFCIKRSDTEYDYYSALEPKEVCTLLTKLYNWTSASSGHFISKAEENYLEKTHQVAVIQNKLNAGSMVGLSDLIFRRTDQHGLKLPEIVSIQSQGYVLDSNVSQNTTVNKNDFKRARIGVLVACRMKSSRLKNKAILPINGVTAVERCLLNCLKIRFVDEVVLTTSDLDEDLILQDFTIDGAVKFWRGEPDDVIRRYISACDQFGIDVIIRVTADCPVISDEIAEILLKSHFENGADYTAVISGSVGSCVEIYNTEALRRVICLLGNAEHSEYMSWYMQNNSDIFKVNLVTLPSELQRDYRLTLDYMEDLEMFNQLFAELEKNSLEPNIRNVFKVLDENPLISALNKHCTLRYQTDQVLIDKLNAVTRITSDRCIDDN